MLSDNVRKEGWMEKRSRYLGQWRKRWCVLNHTTLYTFKNKYSTDLDEATETIHLSGISNLRDAKYATGFNCSFMLFGPNKERFYFRVNSYAQKQDWIRVIGGAMVRASPSYQVESFNGPLESSDEESSSLSWD